MNPLFKFVLLVACVASTAVAWSQAGMPSSTTRYATDAYPGFDRQESVVMSARKTPRWFSWWNGPEKATAREQLAWAQFCQAAHAFRAARKGYDALVRTWPSEPEAAKAQEALADLYLEVYQDYEEAFREYKYLLDYYSSSCDYNAVAFRLYEVAQLMEKHGKRLLLMHFENTTAVRRAYEAVVLRAPGATYAPAAMLKVALLREREGQYEEAVQVYENLRSIYSTAAEAKTALYCEARTRMKILREHSYNRQRATDVVAFLKLALTTNPPQDEQTKFEAWLAESVTILEDEAYAATTFYDSPTRTKRSAMNAYRQFLKQYPASRHAPAAQARLTELEQEGL